MAFFFWRSAWHDWRYAPLLISLCPLDCVSAISTACLSPACPARGKRSRMHGETLRLAHPGPTPARFRCPVSGWQTPSRSNAISPPPHAPHEHDHPRACVHCCRVRDRACPPELLPRRAGDGRAGQKACSGAIARPDITSLCGRRRLASSPLQPYAVSSVTREEHEEPKVRQRTEHCCCSNSPKRASQVARPVTEAH